MQIYLYLFGDLIIEVSQKKLILNCSYSRYLQMVQQNQNENQNEIWYGFCGGKGLV